MVRFVETLVDVSVFAALMVPLAAAGLATAALGSGLRLAVLVAEPPARWAWSAWTRHPSQAF